MASASLTLKPLAPYRLDLTAWTLRRLPRNEMDRWDGTAYGRTLVVGASPVEVTVVQEGAPKRPTLRVATGGGRATQKRQAIVAETLTQMLGVDVDLSGFYRMAGSDSRLRQLVAENRGAKPPRFPSVFEALTNGTACQQISLEVGITLLNRLTAQFGLALGERHAFTRGEDIASARAVELRALGFSEHKAAYVLAAAKAAVAGRLDAKELGGLDDEALVERLRELPGVGRWTAQYVSLRGLGRLDVFPGDDLGGQERLKEWLGLKARPDYDKVRRILDRWRPWRGLIYFQLLLGYQRRRGFHETQLIPK